jgi:hypothetical protein
LGEAKRTEIQTGVSDGQWIEVTNRVRTHAGAEPTLRRSWTPIDGSEEVILGDLSTRAEGAGVRVVPAKDQTQLTRADPESKPSKIPPGARNDVPDRTREPSRGVKGGERR